MTHATTSRSSQTPTNHPPGKSWTQNNEQWTCWRSRRTPQNSIGEPKRKTAYLCIQAVCWPKISGIILYKPSFSQSTVVGKPKLSSNATLSYWKHQPHGMSTHPRPWRDPWWGWGWANPKSFAKWRFRNPKRGQEFVESYSNCEKLCMCLSWSKGDWE